MGMPFLSRGSQCLERYRECVQLIGRHLEKRSIGEADLDDLA